MPQPGQGRPVVARNAHGQPGRWKSVRPDLQRTDGEEDPGDDALLEQRPQQWREAAAHRAS